MTPADYRRIGARLCDLRCERGLTVSQLVQRLDCDPSTVYAIEKGRHGASMTLVFQLADVLHVEPLDLLVSPESSPRAELIDLSRRLRPYQLLLLVRRAREMVRE